MKLPIRKDVPFPRGGRKQDWPWSEMQPGDSVAVPFNMANAARVSARHHANRHGGQFASAIDEKEPGKVGIWRLE